VAIGNLRHAPVEKSRAYAAHLLPPAPQPQPWGLGRGCSLYPPPPARPAAPHFSKSRPPASSSAAAAIGHLHHAPAAINGATMPPTGSDRHPGLNPGAEGVAATLTRRQPRRQPLSTPRNRTPRLQQRRRGHWPPLLRASRNKARARAMHRLPPALRPPPWSLRIVLPSCCFKPFGAEAQGRPKPV